MGFYTKKPVTIEAFQLPPSGTDADPALMEFLHGISAEWEQSDKHGSIIIHTLEGDMEALPGDWIIKGVKGEFYPCKPDIFEATYSPAREDAEQGAE